MSFSIPRFYLKARNADSDNSSYQQTTKVFGSATYSLQQNNFRHARGIFLCDLSLERARLAFAQIEALSPLNSVFDGSPPKPKAPGAEKMGELRSGAAKQIAIAAMLVEECGYHRRDAELAELQSVLKGERNFVSLSISV
jgi:hypothetical protein